MTIHFHSVLWHCWLGDRKGIRPVKSWVLVCWWWRFDWSFARLKAPVVTSTTIILSSNKSRMRDILVPANTGPPGKMAAKPEWERERERERERLPSLNRKSHAWTKKDLKSEIQMIVGELQRLSGIARIESHRDEVLIVVHVHTATYRMQQ